MLEALTVGVPPVGAMLGAVDQDSVAIGADPILKVVGWFSESGLRPGAARRRRE